METFSLLWIECGPLGGLPTQLDLHQAKNPKDRLVSVMLLPRNPGEAQKYQAVWAASNDIEQSRG